jgi:hypothetical protein
LKPQYWRETLGLLAVGLDRFWRGGFARPERREPYRRVELDDVVGVDPEIPLLVCLAQTGEKEVAGAVERVQATEAGGRVRGIPLRLGATTCGPRRGVYESGELV